MINSVEPISDEALEEMEAFGRMVLLLAAPLSEYATNTERMVAAIPHLVARIRAERTLNEHLLESLLWERSRVS